MKRIIKTKSADNELVKFICRIKRNKHIYFCNYNPLLDSAIQNFRRARTVRVIKGIVYIESISFGFFTEILDNPVFSGHKERVPYTIITTLA